MLHVKIQFPPHYGRLWEVKNKENFKLLALKVVVVAYESWLLTRGSKYIDLTGKHLVFLKTGHCIEERWSQPEVQLYLSKQ